MSEVGGVFIDIFGRLNMGSFAKVFGEVNRMAKEEGAKASESFGAGFDTMKAQYAGLVDVANDAYRDMELGLGRLQVAEAEINDLRARGFRSSTDQMIAAQERLNKAIADGSKFAAEAEAARSRAALATPIGVSRGREDSEDRGGRGREDKGRGRITPIPTGRPGRIGNALGFGAFAATAVGGFEATKESMRMQADLNRLVTQSQENPLNIKGIQDAVMRIAGQTGYGPDELAKASLQIEKRGYTATTGPGGYKGNGLEKMLQVSAQLSKLENIDLTEAVKGLSITAENYNKTPDQLADLASGLNVAVGKSGTTLQGLASALPNVEVVAKTSGFQNSDVWASLATLTRSGFEPERAGMNLASLIRSTSGQAGAPAQNMLNTLLAAGKSGETAGDIYNKSSQLGLAGTVEEIFNKGITPNLSADQQHVVLPAYFENLQANKNTADMVSGLQTDAAKRFAQNNPEFKGGMMSGFKVRSTGKTGVGSQLLAEGASPEDIDKLSQLADKYKQINGYSNILKNNQSGVQNIESVLGRAFGTVEAGRSAMVIHGQYAEQQQTRKEIDDAKADQNGNVEGFTQAMNTAAGQADRLKSSLKEVAISLGDTFQGPLKDVLHDLADFANFLVKNKTLLDAFAISIGAVGTAWLGIKAAKMGKNVLGDFTGAAKGVNNFFNPPAVGGKGAAEVGGINEGIQTSAAELKEGGAAAGAELREGGASAGASLKEGATAAGTDLKTSGAAAGTDLKAGGATASADLKTGAAASAEALKAGSAGVGAELKEGAAAAAAELREGGAAAAAEIREGSAGAGARGMGGVGGPLATAAMAAGMGDDVLSALRKKFPTGVPNDVLKFIQTNPATGIGAYHWLFGDEHPEKHSTGGIVGYKGGTDSVDPMTQPLMGIKDMGTDSVLATVNGKPVGLRGHEGILTPEAVDAIGGKSALDALNSGNYIDIPGGHGHTKGNVFDNPKMEGNPWEDPVGVGTTFFGSFAKGVAKYSPWGKYLTAASQSIDSMAKDWEEGNKVHGAGQHHHRRESGLPLEIEQMLAKGMSQQEILEKLGAKKGKRGGYELPSGQYLSNKDKALLGLPITHRGEKTPQGGTVGVPGSSRINPGAEKWRSLVEKIAGQRGVSPSWVNPLLAQISTESNGDPRSINDHDSDGRGGTQTVEGLFNFLPSTFQGAGGGDIFDPATQINNAITYGLGKPGSTRQQPQGFGYGQGWAHGGVVGYSTGGIVGFDQGTGSVPLNPAPPGGPSPGTPQPVNPTPPPRPNSQGVPPGVNGPMSDGKPDPRWQGGNTPAGTKGPPPGPPDRQAPPPPPKGVTPGNDTQTVNKDMQGALTPGDTKPGNFAKPDDRKIDANPSRQGGEDNQSKGFGVGGGALGMAEGAASMAANAFAPGSGQGAQMAFALANRAIGYGGQLLGIFGEGLMETFLPNDSSKGDPTKNIFGKVALGIAGAHPSPQNSAGASAMQLQPKQDLDAGANSAKQVMPMVHIDEIHNHTGDHSNTIDALNKGIFQATGGMPVGGSNGY